MIYTLFPQHRNKKSHLGNLTMPQVCFKAKHLREILAQQPSRRKSRRRQIQSAFVILKKEKVTFSKEIYWENIFNF